MLRTFVRLSPEPEIEAFTLWERSGPALWFPRWPACASHSADKELGAVDSRGSPSRQVGVLSKQWKTEQTLNYEAGGLRWAALFPATMPVFGLRVRRTE
jgi:hypothetical protein